MSHSVAPVPHRVPASGESRSFVSSIGSRLARFLYPSPARRSVAGIFRWWEKRRLKFNLIVAGGGAVSMTTHYLLGLLQGVPGGLADNIAFPMIAILVAANLCYTLGPMTEAALHKIWGREIAAVGPHLLRAGLALSVGVTLLLPMMAAGLRFFFILVEAVFGPGMGWD